MSDRHPGDGPVILDNVPMPPKRRGRPRNKKWEFLDEMNVGSAAIFENFRSDEEERSYRKRVGSIISNRYPPGSEKKFAVRTLTTGGFGVWRTQ